MEIRLRPMQADEYEAYQTYFVQDYAQEIMDNYGHSNLVAIKMAKAAIEASFPDGVTEENEALLCIDLGEPAQLVGYLWRIINQEDNSCFISDFYVLPEHRSSGLGKLALKALEDTLKPLEIGQIKLRVAYQNKRAADLYLAAGYTITGINMSKLLS
ncbi:putative acetyltransferase [Marinomonas sp. MED121]|uniref:GNAT family N-acetyltransferase n=1 Tax=Marinomonas sp. MED121 TaxID=314277 RepID=UPI00006901B3|nr:GNAT family N-acetyltransferase [Marinomonas sp. MED121]EAQ64450.1 putative acetyltransferase [Marinomonas sp. MED121]